MRIDRAAFLLSTSALATAAFSTRPPPAQAATVGEAASDDWPAAEGGGGGAPALPGCGHGPRKFDPSKTGCHDETGTPGDCTKMNRSGSCQPFPFPVEQCQRWQRDFKPGVAQQAVECALKLSAAEVCDACYTYRCAYRALVSSCSDPAAATACATITKACPSAKPEECLGYLSGMSAAGQAKMVACMSNKAGCGYGLYSCAEGL